MENRKKIERHIAKLSLNGDHLIDENISFIFARKMTYQVNVVTKFKPK